MPPQSKDRPKLTSRGVFVIGAVVFIACVGLMFLPLVIPLGKLARFVVAPAFVGACVGLSIIANAMIDRWRGRRE